MTEATKIMCFSWNTESIRLCESLSQKVVDYNRSVPNQNSKMNEESWYRTGYNMLASYSPSIPGYSWLDCQIPDVFLGMREMITSNSPDIVAIGFQEDAYPGSYFHSHLLKEEMLKMRYTLVKRTKLLGAGITTYKAALDKDIKLRGLRTSIYAKFEVADGIKANDEDLINIFGNDQDEYLCSSTVSRGKGATASYLNIKGKEGVIAIINAHLPFNAKSLISSRESNNKMLRQNALNSSNICFNNIIEKLVLDKNNNSNAEKISHVIYMGDLNYRIWGGDKNASEISQMFIDNPDNKESLVRYYREGDELLQQMNKENIYKFDEGVSNQGPIFLPTCKMIKGRDESCQFNEDTEVLAAVGKDCWNLGKHNQRIPSWCDRILYQKFNANVGSSMHCTMYDRFDKGDVIKGSDHAGVVALFNLI